MADDIYYLTEEDREFIRLLRQQQRQGVPRPYARPVVSGEDYVQAPDVYIAKTPVGGIPALVDTPGPETGTSTSTGTGAGGGMAASVSYAECTIYRITLAEVFTGTEASEAILEKVVDFGVRVYNIHQEAIPGGIWIGIHREKSGSWIAQPFFCCGTTPSTGTGTGTGTQVGTGTGTETQAGTGTGTGTGTSGCSPITFKTEEAHCEDGILNIYSRDVTLDIVHGCLSKVVGNPVLSRTEGDCGGVVTHEVHYTNIHNFTNYTENVVYFNGYDHTLNINIAGIWYTYCDCTTGTGANTGTGTVEGPTGTGGSGVTVVCCGNSLPTALTVTASNRTGTCTCWPDSFALTWNGTSYWYNGSVGCLVLENADFQLTCPSGSDCSGFRSQSTCFSSTAPNLGCSCSPLSLVFDVSTFPGGCCTGSARFTVTE